MLYTVRHLSWLMLGASQKGRPVNGRECAFTLIEFMGVITIMVTMMALVAPAFTRMKNANDVTKAAYEVAGVLEGARAYAIANNTYVWVGFYEEDASKASTLPATPGTGRIVLSVVASKDGTLIHDVELTSPATAIDRTRLSQIDKLVKIDNAHLKTFSSETGNSDFDTRPAVTGATARIGDVSPPNPSLSPFQYPVTSSTAQYNFTKAIEISPRGEVRVNNTNYSVKPIVEIGLQPTYGTLVDTANRNVAAVQITGVLGNVKIYRR